MRSPHMYTRHLCGSENTSLQSTTTGCPFTHTKSTSTFRDCAFWHIACISLVWLSQ